MLEKKHARYSGYARRWEEADIKLGVALAGAKDHACIRALATLSEVGGWKSVFALSAGTAAFGVLSGNPRLAAAGRHMLGASILASLAKTSAKHLVHRTRPNVLMDTGLYTRGWLGPNVGPWQSLPSGHAAVSVAAARAAGRAYPEIRGAAYAGAAGILIVSILRGAHFPSDVIAGSLIGLAAEAGTNALAARPMPQAKGGTSG